METPGKGKHQIKQLTRLSSKRIYCFKRGCYLEVGTNGNGLASLFATLPFDAHWVIA